MKILKKLLIGIVVLFAVLFIISLFLPSKVHVERSLTMNAPVETVFNQVNTLKNWNNWSPWYKLDTAMKMTYEGPASGVGASYSWESENSQVGKGKLTISESVPNSLVVTNLEFNGEMGAIGGYKFEPGDSGVKVTWYFDAEMNGMFHKYMGLIMSGAMNKVFDQGLNDMKTVAESMPPPVTKTPMTVEMTTTSDITYLAIRDTVSIPTIGMKLGMAYGTIQEAMKKQGLEFAGQPLAIYYTDSQTNWDMDAAIPVNKPGKADGKVKPGQLKAGNAVVAHYYGDYSGLGTAYGAIQEYISANNKKKVGAPWEVYVSDPMTEKDTAKWQTDVYFPVE
ncbi:MAG: GyrI-like domain-containing protein [Bacteroidia bacterium]